MNEKERAEIVARAIDALISGLDPHTSERSHTGELSALLDVADQRFRGSLFLAKAGLQHEQAVWRSVVKRIQDSEIEAVANGEPDDEDLGDLGDVVAMRRTLAAEMSTIGESHRRHVWEQVQSRLADSARAQHPSIPDLLRPFRRRSDVVQHPEWRPMPSSLDDSVSFPAAETPALGPMAESTHGLARERVWAEVSSGAHIDDDQPATIGRAPRSPARLVAIAAAVALFTVVVAPLPATGFAEHPVSRAGKAISSLFAREAAPPDLASLPPATVVNGRDASVGEASALAGVEFLEPSQTPDGLVLAESKYYPEAIVGDGSATFVLTYRSEAATLVVYQEPAGGPALAIGEGAGAAVALTDGTPAALVQGSWLADVGLSWISSGSQALIFERAGLFVAIEVTAKEPLPRLLFQVAETLE